MKQKFKPDNIFKFLYYRVISYVYCLLELISPPPLVDHKKIPIIINNFNRLTMLKKLIAGLEQRGYLNIHIIDNLSTYPPLLDYYESCSYQVYYLKKNLGMDALWKSGIYKKFRNNFFVYTDPDIVPVDDCPEDFLLFFRECLLKYRFARKVGFSLMIEDIPDCNILKDMIISCEGHFFSDFKQGDMLFRAPIDTTFALYRPYGKRRHSNNNIEIYRTANPYMARHLPWYSDSRNPDEEERYYIEHSKLNTYWISKCKEILNINREKI